MTIAEALIEGEERLSNCNLPRPRRHAELLLEKTLGIERVELYLNAQSVIDSEAHDRFLTLLQRRERGEPVQYIVGWAPFYGHRFLVGEGVFIPRFDTEILIQRTLELFSQSTNRRIDELTNRRIVLDLCCGCGAIGLSVAVELPQVLVTLADISDIALDYTTQNAMMLGVNDRIENVKWDALTEPPEDWLGRFDLIVANPPYVPAADVPNLHPDVRDGEPRKALTDGGDGLSFYRRWAETLPKIMKPEGRLLVEVGDGAADRVGMILRDSFNEMGQYKDLGDMVRVVEFERIYT